MALIGLGDMAQTFLLRQMTTGMKHDARIAAQELTTGHSADIGRKLRGDMTGLSAIHASLSRLQGYRVATDNAALTANAMQATLGNIDNLTEGVGVALVNSGMSENPNTLTSMVSDAARRFDAVLSALNSTTAGRTLFAGVQSDGLAMADSGSILTALEAHITSSGAATAADIAAETAVWFQSPGGFATQVYLGGAGNTSLAISADDKVDLSITAADPALRDTIQALALVALIDRGNVVPDTDTALNLAQAAGTILLQSNSDRAILAGKLGLAQGRIDQAQTRNLAEGAALQMAQADLVAIDPFEAATRMEAAQSQLETLYAITARLSRLSLVDFLR